MNYEELLASRNGSAMKKDMMPFGSFYKKMSEGTNVNVLDLRHELTDILRFCEALKAESEQVASLSGRHQLHFHVTTDSTGHCSVIVEPGHYQTLKSVINERPAVVAEKHFVERLMKSLCEIGDKLNSQNVYHLCFAPSNILIRKGDEAPMLMFHGSSYLQLNDQKMLYGDDTDFLAPEVIDKRVGDARSEVYSLGKLMSFLYQDSSIPFEYRYVIKKATQQEPDKRYQSVADMLKAMNSLHNIRRSVVTGGLAALLGIVLIGIYLEQTPSQENVEFVESAPKEQFDEDLLPELYDPLQDDSSNADPAAPRMTDKQMKAYEAKAEQIFRKRYAKEAERILSRIYDNEHMNGSEKKFLSESSDVIKELTQKQFELGTEAGLTDIRSQRIASEIIEWITNEKKSKLVQYGAQTKKTETETESKIGSKIESRTGSKIESRTGSKVEPKTDSKAEKVEPQTDPKVESETETIQQQ